MTCKAYDKRQRDQYVIGLDVEANLELECYPEQRDKIAGELAACVVLEFWKVLEPYLLFDSNFCLDGMRLEVKNTIFTLLFIPSLIFDMEHTTLSEIKEAVLASGYMPGMRIQVLIPQAFRAENTMQISHAFARMKDALPIYAHMIELGSRYRGGRIETYMSFIAGRKDKNAECVTRFMEEFFKMPTEDDSCKIHLYLDELNTFKVEKFRPEEYCINAVEDAALHNPHTLEVGINILQKAALEYHHQIVTV